MAASGSAPAAAPGGVIGSKERLQFQLPEKFKGTEEHWADPEYQTDIQEVELNCDAPVTDAFLMYDLPDTDGNPIPKVERVKEVEGTSVPLDHDLFRIGSSCSTPRHDS